MKKILFIMLALMCLAPAAAMAHSKLDSATPTQDATVEASPEQITMIFNTKIEKLSNFKLFNEAGDQIETGKAEVSGDTMTGAVSAILENGAYTVKWTIIGADGHSVEGEYSFKVDARTDEAASPSPSPSPEQSANPASETPAPSPSVEPTESKNDSSYTPFIVIGGIIVVAVILTTLLRRRK